MNNATHENALHHVTVPHSNDEDGLNQLSGQNELTEDHQDTAEILQQLDQIRYKPRAEVIRKILNYSGKKHKALH